MQLRNHRRVLREALQELEDGQFAAPPRGAARLDLNEFVHNEPTMAALYGSGMLCTPRLSMLWLFLFERKAAVAKALGHPTLALHRSMPDGDGPLQRNHSAFWLTWLFCPSLMVRPGFGPSSDTMQ